MSHWQEQLWLPLGGFFLPTQTRKSCSTPRSMQVPGPREYLAEKSQHLFPATTSPHVYFIERCTDQTEEPEGKSTKSTL